MGSCKAFSCGYLKLPGGPDDEPDWKTFGARMDFARDLFGLRAAFLEASKGEDGIWRVPFFAFNESRGSSRSPKDLIEDETPYRVAGYRKMDTAQADAETLSILRDLVCEEVPSSWLERVRPRCRARVTCAGDLFDGLVGMSSQRLVLEKLARVIERCGRDVVDSLHLVFAGCPGTGKTELARRMVDYFDLLRVTDGTGRFVKVGEADLIAKYVGHTAPKVRSVVERALGGVLFIDEFYAIANAPRFGQEAIDCLVDQLDEHRHDFVCVVAGYPNQVDETLDENPGLRERFGYRLEFPDFSTVELEQIFRSMAAARGFEVVCDRTLSPALEHLRSTRGFSNARSVRRLVDHAVTEAVWAHDDLLIDDRDLNSALEQCFGAPQTPVGFAG